MHLVPAKLVVKERSKAARIRQAAREKMGVPEKPIAQVVAAAREKVDVLADLIAQVKVGKFAYGPVPLKLFVDFWDYFG